MKRQTNGFSMGAAVAELKRRGRIADAKREEAFRYECLADAIVARANNGEDVTIQITWKCSNGDPFPASKDPNGTARLIKVIQERLKRCPGAFSTVRGVELFRFWRKGEVKKHVTLYDCHPSDFDIAKDCMPSKLVARLFGRYIAAISKAA